MTADRHLDWDGCVNVRDLGGLRADQEAAIRARLISPSDGDIGVVP